MFVEWTQERIFIEKHIILLIPKDYEALIGLSQRRWNTFKEIQEREGIVEIAIRSKIS